MNSIVRITLEGLPERVHEIADALHAALPDTFEWHDMAGTGEGFTIQIEGVGRRKVQLGNVPNWSV